MCYCCVLVCNQLLAFKEWESAFMSEWGAKFLPKQEFLRKKRHFVRISWEDKGRIPSVGGIIVGIIFVYSEMDTEIYPIIPPFLTEIGR